MLEAFNHITANQLNAMTDDQRKALLAAGLGQAFQESAVEHVTWLFWAKKEAAPLRILGQGSAFLLDLGHEIILVTAAHVYRQYLCDLHQHDELYCQIANSQIYNLCEHLIACGNIRVPQGEADVESDIATFRLPKGAAARIGKKPITYSSPERGSGLQVSQQVMLVGYPAQERIVTNPDTVEFGSYSGMSGVNSMTEHQITVRFERAYMVAHGGCDLPPLGYGLGGISGGPMLIPEYADAKWSWRLAGVIVQAPEARSPEEVIFESVIAHRAEYIQSDGRLSKRL